MRTKILPLLAAALMATGCATAPELPWYDKSLHTVRAESLAKFESAEAFQDYNKRLSKLQYVPPKQNKSKNNQNDGDLLEEIVVFAQKVAVDSTTISSAGITDVFDMQQSVPGLAQGSTSGEQVTNVQEPGVDEGDIVKRFGRFLIVLRDGRLFSIDTGIASGGLILIDRINVYRSLENDT